MACYFGFDAVSKPGEHWFISYSRFDTDRIKKIVLQMHDMGIPIWYDNGLLAGDEWKLNIVENIRNSKLVIFFLTKDLFKREDTFVRNEFGYAEDLNVKKICVFLDDVSKIPSEELSTRMLTLRSDMGMLQGIEVFNIVGDENKAAKIVEQIKRTLDNPNPHHKRDSHQEPDPKPKIKEILTLAGVVTAMAAIVVVSFALYGFFHDSNDASTSDTTPESTSTSSESTATTTTATTTTTTKAYTGSLTMIDDITSVDELYVGQHVIFGMYEQNNKVSDGKEYIEWRVLAVTDGKALIISEYLLDSATYNDTKEIVTWEDCSLRVWMNTTFLNDAFTNEQKQKIALSTVSNSTYNKYDRYGGNDTTDRFFALSEGEAVEYFSDAKDRTAYPTDYAKYNGCTSSTKNSGAGWWWLRSPGDEDTLNATYVSWYGGPLYNGLVVYNSGGARPACWISI